MRGRRERGRVRGRRDVKAGGEKGDGEAKSRGGKGGNDWRDGDKLEGMERE